jgi:hypothetical protein
MAHFAELNSNNKVTRVVVVSNEWILDENGQESEEVGVQYLKNLFGDNTNYKQTSYNNNFRVRFASVGYTYDENLDAFIPPDFNF